MIIKVSKGGYVSGYIPPTILSILVEVGYIGDALNNSINFSSNSGSILVYWRIKNNEGVVQSSGNETVSFSNGIGSLQTAIYPDFGYYTLEVKTSSSSWVVSNEFLSDN